MQDTRPELRHFEPVSGLLWQELGTGEGKSLYGFLRRHNSLHEMEGHMRELNTFSPAGLSWRKGLQNLLRVVIRDHPSLVEELGRLARTSTLEEFARAFDGTVAGQIMTYEGQHTRFMWEAPEFLGDLREALRKA